MLVADFFVTNAGVLANCLLGTVCRNQALNNNVGTSHASCVKVMPNILVEYEDAVLDSHQMIHGRFLSKGPHILPHSRCFPAIYCEQA